MLRESIGAAIRGTGRKAARTPLSVWIAALLLVLAVFTSLVSGVQELRLQAQSREALAQVKSARMAARIVSAQCFSAGQPRRMVFRRACRRKSASLPACRVPCS